MDQLEQSRVIDYNERYHYIPPNTKIVLSSTAESVSYNVANGSGASDTNLSFMLEPEGNFLDRAISLSFPETPLKITRDRVAGAGGETVAEFLGGAIAMRQYGILNAISSVKVVLDGRLTLISNDPAKNLQVISMFADKDLVQHFFQNSAPDLFAKYSDYSSDSTTIDVVPIHGNTTVAMRRPIFATGDIFSAVTDAYSSRIPLISGANITAGLKVANVTLHDQRCLLPMSLFGLPTDELPLYNCKKIAVTITLHGDWPRRIFSIRTTGAAGTEIKFDDIVFDRTNLTNFKPQIDYVVRTGPKDSPELASRPFAVELPVIEQSANTVETTIVSRGTYVLPLTKFDITCIPKKSFIFVRAKHATADAADPLAITKTADLFARIDSLKVRVGTKETTIANRDAGVTYNLAQRFGLTKSFEQACYLNGFAVPIDYSETLGLEPGALVGTNATKNGGSPSIWVSLSCTNLSDMAVVYEVGVIHAYQAMLMSHDNTWSLKSSFESWYDSDSGVQDLQEQLMSRYNYIGGRHGGGIGAFFSSVLPKIGNGLKNLVTAAFTDPNFRKTISNAWSGPKPPLLAAQNGGASFDNHAPFGGFYAHSNNYNQSGGASIKQWSSQ